jgi:energy-coupling factor transporter transmembrane protein EcfT
MNETERDLLIRISERIEGIYVAMEKLEKADSTKADQRTVDALAARLSQVEKDQTSLQEFKWKAVGMATVIGAVISFAIEMFVRGH